MNSLFLEFAVRCMKAKVIPAEKEIISFLMSVGKPELFDEFVKTCFYKWKEITNQIRIENAMYL
jgi:hypothetical protein